MVNIWQRIILILIAIVLIALLLYPPWHTLATDNKFANDHHKPLFFNKDRYSINSIRTSEINTDLFFIQYLIIISAGIFLFVAFKNKNQ